jgi:hypothetical protein
MRSPNVKNMKKILLISSALFLSGCSCAITSVSYSPATRRPSSEVFARAASKSGFRFERGELDLSSYSKGVMGMHFTSTTGRIDFVNSHCPVIPFWTQPERAFEKRWDDMNLMLKQLDSLGFPYRRNEAEHGAAGRSAISSSGS